MQSQQISNHIDSPFGKALENLIENQKTSDANRQIKLIQRNNGALNTVDQTGRNFLMHALDKKTYGLAKRLLELLKDDNVLFSIDQDGRCALHAALDHHFITIRLMQIALQKKRLTEYLVQDTLGNTILHAPFFYGSDTILESVLSVLDYLKTKADSSIAFNQFINLVNQKGETALHLAFRLNRPRIIKSLIKYGADLTIKDHTRIAPILFFATLPFKEDAELISLSQQSLSQQSIFLSLDKDKKKELLVAYRELLIEHINNKLLTNLMNDVYMQFLQNNSLLTNLKENYFKLTKLYDLKTFLLAMHEFDDRVPLKKTYERIRALENEIIVIPNMPLEVALLEQMPLYVKKLGFITRAEYDLENDEDILTNLVDSLDNGVKKIEASCSAITNKGLAVLIPIIWLVGVVWLDVWLFSNFSELSDQAHKKFIKTGNFDEELEYRETSYLVGGFCVLTFGIVMTALLISVMVKLWHREVNVTSDEWEPVIDQLQGILVSRKHALVEQYQNKLPTMKTNLDGLEAGITTLKAKEPGYFADFPTPRKPISSVTTILHRLLEIVENIRATVIQEKISLGLKRLPSSIGLFKPKKTSPYLPLPKEGYLLLPEEDISESSSSDDSSNAEDRDGFDSIKINLYHNTKKNFLGKKSFFVSNTSSDEDAPLLPIVERKELTKQEIFEKSLGKDWDGPPMKTNFRFRM